ncbi:glycosyltransferase family 2 protein [Sphingobium boeckii]|uniref:Succinoglycan biosynthesis protein ExoA n=1 Tax=Sphingobium boeckii TaxID=1082345 RepID=A0A7W9AHL0_9SPHN|nr:glycosyltransferase family 2 protein [Sphingobium boeckii]MBB5685755.1 succinoglycan biosynthesis protein ExoA [Sphingobium boeckii]
MTIASGAAVIIPTFNEAAHIGGLLEQLLRQKRDVVGQILVADGRSQDATRAIVAQIAAANDRVHLIDNPDRLQSAGINRAAAAADPAHGILVRMDAHSGYADDYVARLIRTLQERDTESVVVRLRTVGRTCMEKAIAAVSNSIFGTGGAAHRIGGQSRLIDHGHHAAFRRDAFQSSGGYDVHFIANEDAEFDYRLRRAGGRIWLAADIEVDYFPRSTLGALARQYWRYGRGRAQNFLKHREKLRARQLVAPLLVVMLAASTAVSLVQPYALALPLLYAAGCCAAALWLALRARSICVMLAAPALWAMHLCWGAGFITTMVMKK